MSSSPELIITTAGLIQGYRITKYLGIVRGTAEVTTRESQSEPSQNKSKLWDKPLEEDRRDHWEKSHERMIDDAKRKASNAVLGVTYACLPKISGGEFTTDTDVEVICYGTAVLIEAE